MTHFHSMKNNFSKEKINIMVSSLWKTRGGVNMDQGGGGKTRIKWNRVRLQ